MVLVAALRWFWHAINRQLTSDEATAVPASCVGRVVDDLRTVVRVGHHAVRVGRHLPSDVNKATRQGQGQGLTSFTHIAHVTELTKCCATQAVS